MFAPPEIPKLDIRRSGMDTCFRYNAEEKQLLIHAKEKFFIDPSTYFQIHGRLNTHTGAARGIAQFKRRFYPEGKQRGVVELTCKMFNFTQDQDVRLKIGFDLFEKKPYFQVRENNWTLNTDINGRWTVKYDL